jgi:hypothetical protein
MFDLVLRENGTFEGMNKEGHGGEKEGESTFIKICQMKTVLFFYRIKLNS